MTGLLRWARQKTVPLNQNGQHNFAARHALVAYRSGAVFSFIPKNSCTSLRYSLALENGVLTGPEDFPWIHDNNGTFAATLPELVRARSSVVILRCPHARLASAFLDKFVRYEHDAWLFRRHLRDSFELPDLTFRAFVEALVKEPGALRVNIHWRPQVEFLVYEDYTLWVPLHQLGAMTDRIAEVTGLRLHDTRGLAGHSVSALDAADGSFADTPLRELHALRLDGKAPRHAALYDSELTETVARLYAADLTLYEERLGRDGLLFGGA